MQTREHAKLPHDPTGYSRLAKLLHWTMAFLTLAVAGVGIYMTPYDADGAFTEQLYVGHKSFGVILLFLWLLRVSNKILSSPLEPIAGLKTYEVKLSRAAHLTFYFLLFAVPVLGYIQSSSYAEGGGVSFFGGQLPELVPDDDTLFQISNTLHKYSAYAVLVLVGLHVSGVLKHHFLDRPKKPILKRMI